MSLTDSPNPVRRRLLARIHRSYATAARTVRFNSINLTFTRIADPDRVLDQVAADADRRERITGRRENDDHLHLPYWAELWDSAVGLAQHLAGTDEENRGILSPPEGLLLFNGSRRIRALDLGCGMGLSGTVAAALGASVLFADIETPALLFARLNSLPWAPRVRTRRLNWRTDRLDERFELILGADILYERAQWEPLDLFWQTHLAPGGAVLLGEPGRQTGDLFQAWIAERGWQLRVFEEKVASREKPIRIFRLIRSDHPRSLTSAVRSP